MLTAEKDSLEHYGRLGMKWYQHIYGDVDGRAKYQEKGFKKLDKAQKSSVKNQTRADTYKAKADMKRNKAEKISNKLIFKFGPIDTFRVSRNDAKASKYAKKAYKAQRRVSKATRSGERTAKKMIDMFGEIQMSELSPEQIRLGQQYVLDLLDDRERNKG